LILFEHTTYEKITLTHISFVLFNVGVTAHRYPYFDVVVGLVWSYEPESYVGSNVAIGRVAHAGQVKGDDPDEKGYPGPPGIWNVLSLYRSGALPEGTCQVGRPIIMWLDSVEENLKTMGFRNCR
jgi:hypothetical protein